MASYHVDINGNVTKNDKKKKKPTYSVSLDGNVTKHEVANNDIAPSKSGNGYFKESTGNTGEAIVGTTTDVSTDFLTGALKLGEGIIDGLLTIAPYVAQGQYYQNGGAYQPLELQKAQNETFEIAKKGSAEMVAKDIIDEETIAKNIIGSLGSASYMAQINQGGGFATPEQLQYAQTIRQESLDYIENDMESHSVLDEKSDAIVESVGQFVATQGLNMVGVPWFMTTGLSVIGSQTENAMVNEGATFEEATASAVISAGGEILSEFLVGGTFEKLGLDELVLKQFSKRVSSKLLNKVAKVTGKSFGEGLEEVFSETISKLGQKLTYADEMTWAECFLSEDHLDALIGGMFVGGISNTANAIKMESSGIDYLTENTHNEQKVIEAEVESRVAEKTKKDGKKPTDKEIADIREQVQKAMERGEISIDTIEKVLGGDGYNQYTESTKNLEALEKEFKKLGKTKNPTLEQMDRRNELKELIKDAKKNNATLKEQLSNNVSEIAKSDRLNEAYLERVRAKQSIEIDANSYKSESAKKTAENFMKSGLVQNTHKAHDFVDLAMRIAEDQGVEIDVTTSKKLMESVKNGNPYKIDVDPNKVEAFVTGDNKKIIINMDANKSLNSLTGHEITHTFEKASNYDALQSVALRVAELKGELKSRQDSINKRYAHLSEEARARELTADIIGDYLLTDSEFISNLSVEEPNVFKRIWNEIKYLCKMATAGSKELRELERVKHEFEKAWAERGKTTTETESADMETKFSIREEAPPTNTKKAYKLMRLVDGKLYPLFIGNNEEVAVGVWYNADSPNLSQLKNLPEGTHLIDMKTGEAKSWDEYAEEYVPKGKDGNPKRSKPSVEDIHWANDNGYRFMQIVEAEKEASKTRMLKQYGDTRAYYNWGVNGSAKSETGEGSASTYALRPGWHFGELPSMHQIGYGEKTNPFRLDNQVWVEVDMSADVDYNEEAKSNWGGDIPTHIPTDGYYKFATNPTQKKTKGGNTDNDSAKGDWYVAGAFKVNRIISDSEADAIVDAYNNKNGTNVPRDYRRLNGRVFNAETMQVEDSNIRYSLSDSDGRDLSKEQLEYFKDSKVRDDNGNLKVVYHGTRKADFTVFNRNHTYFTDSKEVADSYAPTSEMHSGYLNMKNPFVIDAKGDRWSGIAVSDDVVKMLRERGSSVFKERGAWRTSPADIVAAIEDGIDEGLFDYDGVIIKNVDDTGGYYKGRNNVVANDYIVFNSNQFKRLDNTNPTSDADIRFSLSDTVEETRDLMAIHNLHSSELLKQIEMGGIPYPSIAITKPSTISHEGFGEISLILHKDSIDPKKSKYNKIYGADAYTPTFPQVDYEANREVANAISEKVVSLYDSVPEYYQRSLSAFTDYVNINERLNSERGEYGLIERYTDDYGMKQLYLAEKGEVVPIEIKRSEVAMTDYQKEISQYIIDKLGVEVIEQYKVKNPHATSPMTHRKQWLVEHGEQLKNAYSEKLSKDANMSLAEAREIVDYEEPVFWLKTMRETVSYLENGGVTVKEEADYGKTQSLIDEKIDSNDYKQWVKHLFKGIEGNRGIRNNKDTFTQSGNRRSFAQLHDPVTIDNVINAMRKKEQTGQGAFGLGNIQGASAQEYGSISEVRANKERLGKMDEEEHREITRKIEDTMNGIVTQYANGKDFFDAKATLVEAVSRYETKSAITKYLKQYDYVYSYNESIVDDLIDLRNFIRSLPTPYFEAKPRRAVGLDEVAVYVIPYDVDPKLKQSLLNGGYSIAEYDPNVEGDRQRVLNQFDELKFRLADEVAPKEYGDFNIYGKDIRLNPQEEVAPTEQVGDATEEIAPTPTVSQESINELSEKLHSKLKKKKGVYAEQGTIEDWSYYVYKSASTNKTVVTWWNGEERFNASHEPTTSTEDALYSVTDFIAKRKLGNSTDQALENILKKREEAIQRDADAETEHEAWLEQLHDELFDRKTGEDIEGYETIKGRFKHAEYVEHQRAKNKVVRADSKKVQEADDKVAEILDAEPVKETDAPSFGDRAMEKFVDKGYVFEKLAKKTKNRELEGKWDFIRRAEGMAQNFIGKGKGDVKALADVQKEVEGAGLTHALEEYVYHLHNVDRMTLADRFDGEENKPVFGYSVDANASREAIAELEAEHPELKGYAEELYKINNHLRDKLVEGGVISQETAELWEVMYPHYMPIRRVDYDGLNVNVPLDTNRTGVNAPIKRATGGNSDIRPLFGTMADRISQTYKAVAKNSFGVELKNTLGTVIGTETSDMDGVLEGVDNHEDLLQEGKNGRKPTFTVFENGERVTFEIDKLMYEAMRPTDEFLAQTHKIPNKIMSFHRGLLTQYNPAFMIRNPIKDSQDVLINSQHPAKTYANFPKAIKELTTKGNWYTEYMENGGELNTYFDKTERKFVGEDTGIKKWLNKIGDANDFVEKLPRLAEYIASREEGRSVEVSMLDAARVTTNFQAGGDVTKYLNRNGATFLNASVQGTMQQVRNIQEAKMNGLKGYMHLATKYAVAGIPFVILNGLMWDDDEEYEELSDYVKQNYYVVAKYGDGKFVRIPKGRMLAVIQNAFEQMKNVATGDDEVDLGSFLQLAITNLAPNNPVEDNIIAPIIQVANNKTWYGDDLVPTRLQDLPEAEQFDETTDSISKWLGETLNVSPYKINYLLDQYSGAIGDTFLPMLTPEAESGDEGFLNQITAPIRDAFTTDSTLKNQNVTDFYSKSDELTVNANRHSATDTDILSNKYFNSVKAEVGELYGEKREVQNSNLSDSEKYNRVREIQAQINALTKEALSQYDKVNIDGSYATVGDRHYRLTDSGWQKIDDKQLEKQDKVTSDLGISASDYWDNKEEYDYAYENSAKYSIAQTVGGYESYKAYLDDLNDIYADKDSSGKTITGSAKRKKAEYINSLDLDYGQKIILYRSLYDSKTDKATYNADIVEYLNSRDDISYEQMVEILEALDFKVYPDGTVEW